MAGSDSMLINSYRRLMEKAKELSILQSAVSIIHWDMETKMPPRGVALRSQQLALLHSIGHRMAKAPEIGELIDGIESHVDFDSFGDVQKRNIHLMRKDYNEATKLPDELVSETARQRTVTVDAWKRAKAARDFNAYKPDLEKLFELRCQAAEILMQVKETTSPYEALIDIYEPGMTTDSISHIFYELKSGLIKLIEKYRPMTQTDVSINKYRVPIGAQRRVAEALADFIGYDVATKKSGGRIDETEHPFTTGYYDDVRITTHYHEDRFASSIFSILHEGGHALYEQNLPRQWMYQPIGAACSSGLHESQSRFIENIVGRSQEFWSYFFPKLKKLTRPSLSSLTLRDLIYSINKVEPSKIRIEADEVTYSLHIIIRFELERNLFAGKLTIDELPQAWNEKYLEYLDVEIRNDSEGVMQDTHWASGSYGYFPSYALGNIYGGQFLAEMELDLPDWRSHVAAGSFEEVGGWLSEHIHRYGNLYDPKDLIQVVTGEPLDVRPFLSYLDEKYAELYGY